MEVYLGILGGIGTLFIGYDKAATSLRDRLDQGGILRM